MADALYAVEKDCPVCSLKFNVMKVRSRITTVKRDSDFCTYYHGVNPYYYAVWVCPHCGYAFQDGEYATASNDKVTGFLQGRAVKVDLTGVRTREQAVNAYKLAIFYGELAGITNSKLAGLYVHLAWVYREGELKLEEQAALGKAVEYYDKATLRERFPISGMSEISFNYLMGDWLRRLERWDEALQYFNRVISSPQARMEPRLLDLARDAWKDTRDLKKQLQVGTGADAS